MIFVTMDWEAPVWAFGVKLGLLREISALCKELYEAARDARAFSGSRPYLEGGVDGFHAVLSLDRLDDGTVERVFRLFSEDGEESDPVLLLIEEQIDEFIRQTE